MGIFNSMHFTRATSGEMYEHLKDIDLFGRVTDTGDFILYGCRNEDQEKFYQGLLDYDKKTDIQGWETVADVKEYWEEGADMLLRIDKGCFEIVEQPNGGK